MLKTFLYSSSFFRALSAEVSTVSTGGNPIVAGGLDAGAWRTLIFYVLYDVQPAEETGWLVPPFSGSVIAASTSSSKRVNASPRLIHMLAETLSLN